MDKKNFIKISSPNQFEIRTGYLTKKDIKKIDYSINIYFFIPKSLSINSSTYTNNDFYNDHVSYIRLITPKNELGIIKNKIKTLLVSLKANINNNTEKNIIKHKMKLAVCSYISYLKSFNLDMKKKDIKPKRIKLFIKRIKEFDDIKKEILLLKVNKEDDRLSYLTDSMVEYLSLTTQHYLFEINIYLKSFGHEYNDLINDIVKLINTEISFCKTNKFPVISHDEYENEKVIFRYSVFKKYFYSVLYLNQKRKEDGAGVKEFYYAIAAGISMIFTTVVVFITQQKYGNFTTSFFAALVISYMFKDRIKEAYRHHFDKKIQLKTYDFKEKIYDTEEKTIFAFIKEKMRFVNKDKLPKDVVKTRLKGVPNRLSTWFLGEDVFKYTKNITLYNKNIQSHYNNKVVGIHNIMRFDISKFLKRMDTAEVPLYRIAEGSLYGSKVYHVNIVVEFKAEEEISYHKARLILDKSGIKRIELPEFKIKLFTKSDERREKNWFSLKKSGLLKKIIKEKIIKENILKEKFIEENISKENQKS
jgi:hypothetical protein